MKTHDREILLYYNPESSKDRKTVAYAKSVVKHIKTYTHEKAPSTTTSWRMIIDALGLRPKDLLNKAHPDYQAKIRGKDLDDDGWLYVISKNPHLIKAPIAVRGRKAVLCLTPTDILRLKT